MLARDDMPDAVAYTIAKAIDEHQAALKWYVRPYSYDPNDAWRDPDIPLHPGAARYFRERGTCRLPPAADLGGQPPQLTWVAGKAGSANGVLPERARIQSTTVSATGSAPTSPGASLPLATAA